MFKKIYLKMYYFICYSLNLEYNISKIIKNLGLFIARFIPRKAVINLQDFFLIKHCRVYASADKWAFADFI